MAVCKYRYPLLPCCPVGAHFIGNDLIALFAFEKSDDGISLLTEEHYRLVAPDDFYQIGFENR